MERKLIKLNDGLLVEVEATSSDKSLISSNKADNVEGSIQSVEPLLKKICTPIVSAWDEISKLSNIDSAEIEIGFSFEAEGNLFITRGKASANLKVKLTIKPKKEG